MDKKQLLYLVFGCVITYLLFINYAFERKIVKGRFGFYHLVVVNKITNSCYMKVINPKQDKSVKPKKYKKYEPKQGEPFDFDKYMEEDDDYDNE